MRNWEHLSFEFSHSLSGIEPIKVFVVATLDVAILATLIVLDPSAITENSLLAIYRIHVFTSYMEVIARSSVVPK